jgi:hypothetical protein
LSSRAQLDLQEGISTGSFPPGIETAKLEKFVAEREGGLKGRPQARLPATRKRQPNR